MTSTSALILKKGQIFWNSLNVNFDSKNIIDFENGLPFFSPFFLELIIYRLEVVIDWINKNLPITAFVQIPLATFLTKINFELFKFDPVTWSCCFPISINTNPIGFRMTEMIKRWRTKGKDVKILGLPQCPNLWNVKVSHFLKLS